MEKGKSNHTLLLLYLFTSIALVLSSVLWVLFEMDVFSWITGFPRGILSTIRFVFLFLHLLNLALVVLHFKSWTLKQSVFIKSILLFYVVLIIIYYSFVFAEFYGYTH